MKQATGQRYYFCGNRSFALRYDLYEAKPLASAALSSVEFGCWMNSMMAQA